MCASRVKTMCVRVAGLVQGVGFRAFVVRRASELGAVGWVRNTEDGAVEIEVQADPRTMERFLLDVRRGPRMARIDDFSARTVEDAPAYSTFEIRW